MFALLLLRLLLRLLPIFFLQCHLHHIGGFLYLGILRHYPLQHVGVLCHNFNAVLLPGLASQLLVQIIVLHQVFGHWLLVLDAPENHTHEI